MSSVQSSQQTSSSSSYGGLSATDQASVRALIQQLLTGGTSTYQALREQRNTNMADLQSLMSDYSNDAAFSDAAKLMALNLQQAMEKQMPAIAKSVQGAGTSASSMQGLLSNKIAQDASLNAGALGAEQAKAYAAATASLQGILEKYTEGGDTTAENLLKALSLLSTQTSQSSSQGSSSGSSDQGGGSQSGNSGGGGMVSSGGGYYSGGSTSGGNNGSGVLSGTNGLWEGWGNDNWTPITYPSDSGSSTSGQDGFWYDDWGTGSTGNGDMASNPSASSGSNTDGGNNFDDGYTGYSPDESWW